MDNIKTTDAAKRQRTEPLQEDTVTGAVKTKAAAHNRHMLMDTVYIAMFAAIIAVCSQISISVGPVPFTLQTLGVFVTAGLLGAKRGVISVVVYIAMGLVGIPVFAGFSGGISSLVSPSFGYILGFILTALAVGLGKKLFGTKVIPMTVSMVIGLVLCYIVGTAYFMIVYSANDNPISLATALGWCVIPFIVPDICKIAAAVTLVNRLGKIVKI